MLALPLLFGVGQQELVGDDLYMQLQEDIELLDGVMPELDISKVGRPAHHNPQPAQPAMPSR